MSAAVTSRRRAPALVLLLVSGLALTGCGDSGGPGADSGGGPPDTMELHSEAFADGTDIPERFSCEGENLSPPLAWSKVPDGTAELALVLSDPDAPGATFYHWFLLGIDPSTAALDAGEVPEGAMEAESSSGKAAYIGMCPPDGSTHRYVFTIYALNRRLEVPAVQPPQATLAAIEEAAVARGTLTGRFSR